MCVFCGVCVCVCLVCVWCERESVCAVIEIESRKSPLISRKHQKRAVCVREERERVCVGCVERERELL